MTVRYAMTDDGYSDGLIKEEKDDNHARYFVWNAKEKKWVEDHGEIGGYFMGFEPRKDLTDEEAKKIMEA